MTCSQDCLNHPDAVEKINWKCVECKTDLKPAFDVLMAKKDAESKAKLEAEATKNDGELTEEEKQSRRDMYV